MDRLVQTSERQRGFTLVELIVVIAILGFLTALVAPGVSRFLAGAPGLRPPGSGPRAQAYNASEERIQKAVDAFYSDPVNVGFIGPRPQYPIFGAEKIHGLFVRPDGNLTGKILTVSGNPLGGTRGGTPVWVDDANGIRDVPDEEFLHDENDSSSRGWHVTVVNREGFDYIVDSRDFFIDFDKLADPGYLDEVPASPSSDNQSAGSNKTLVGPYSWCVDKDTDKVYRFDAS